ncbi:MAG: hypothetical protein JWR21_3722 [Herminiimonas sp.]|nr:hypothetical protein [Herminiimonas sp.]
MSKYTEELKLVEQYLADACRTGAIAVQHRLSNSLVRRWIGSYRVHSIDGLKKKFTHYSAEFKLTLLQRIRNDALSYEEAAVTFNICNAGILSAGEHGYCNGGIDALRPSPKGRPIQLTAPTTKPEPKPDDEKRSRDELLAELNHLRMENAYLKRLQSLVQGQHKATPPAKRK